MNTLNPRCKICNEYLSRDGIFITSLDPFYMLVDDKKINNNYLTITYHVALDFFLEEISDGREKILEQNFFHTECAPNNIKILLPTEEDIRNYLNSNNVGNAIQVKLSLKKARESRIPGKPKKQK